jgi:hypothetical protein
MLLRACGVVVALFLCAAAVGCGGCVSAGSSPALATEAGPEPPRVVEDLDVHVPLLGANRFNLVDLGELSLRVPDSWVREDLDAGWSVVRFEAPGNVGARLQVMRHPVGEPWDDTIAGLLDAGWEPREAGDATASVFKENLPVVRHEVARILLNGMFLVAIHCQYLDDSARPRCDEQLERLELDVSRRDAGPWAGHGFRFERASGWHALDEPPSNVPQLALASDDSQARVLMIGSAVGSAHRATAVEEYKTRRVKEPGVTIKSQKPVTYRGRPGIELELDEATSALFTLRVAEFELPTVEAIVSCLGPSIPELDLVCETSMRGVVIRTTAPH